MSIPQSGGGLIEDRAQLAEYLAAGCKPPEDWRIGTEHEKFGYQLADQLPLPYAGACSIHAMLAGLSDRFGWEPVEEAGNLIGLQKDGANVSLEPGRPARALGRDAQDHPRDLRRGERAFARGARDRRRPRRRLHRARRRADLDRRADAGDAEGPLRADDPLHGQVGSHGTQMMYRTCTVQVNLDFASEADMVQKLRVGLALQPVATALFACSPFFEGRVNGWQSWRARIWRDTDPDRTGMLPFAFEDGMGFERYVDYALDVPMYFVYRDGRLHRRAGAELPRLPRRPAAGAAG